MLLSAIREGVSFTTWTRDGFGFADNFDEAAGRYQGLRGGKLVPLDDADAPGLVVKADVAKKQLEAERPEPPGVEPIVPGGDGRPKGGTDDGSIEEPKPSPEEPKNIAPKRFHGTVVLDTARVGRDAGRIAEEVIAHLSGLVGANVTITLEVEAEIPGGAPDPVVRIVTENCRVLKFQNLGFEKE